MAHSGQSVPDMFQRFRSASITPTIFARWGCIATAAGLTVRTMPLIAAEYTSCAVHAGQTNAAPALLIPFSEAPIDLLIERPTWQSHMPACPW